MKPIGLALALALGIACTARREQSEPAPPSSMPPECEQTLANLDCWLRSGGNASPSVAQVVASIRASFRQQLEESGLTNLLSRCMTMAGTLAESGGWLRTGPATIVRTGIVGVAETRPCGQGSFFFIRNDAKIVGCHRDCLTDTDCPAPQSCNELQVGRWRANGPTILSVKSERGRTHLARHSGPSGGGAPTSRWLLSSAWIDECASRQALSPLDPVEDSLEVAGAEVVSRVELEEKSHRGSGW